QVEGVEVFGAPEANILFCRFSHTLIAGLRAEGFGFYDGRWGPGVVRFVTSFQTTTEDVDHLLASMKRIAGATASKA
ncbi:MAG TPA: low specificity L-threonine aldolase, partial [Pararobbsia sp.]|nr:low specificity L-threonine aldolase [Pararobbsia sp.]